MFPPKIPPNLKVQECGRIPSDSILSCGIHAYSPVDFLLKRICMNMSENMEYLLIATFYKHRIDSAGPPQFDGLHHSWSQEICGLHSKLALHLQPIP